jgi:dsRNA-specific ribonuclease
MIENDEIVVFNAPRNVVFRKFIYKLLSIGKLKKIYIDLLTNDDSLKEYDNAFTSNTAHSEKNYEVYEQLGDLTANKFIVCYMYNRFPKLKCSKAVKIVARLRINYGSKQTFSKIADELGFWDYISASEEERNTKKKSLLEDSFEAFIGATEYLLDTKIRNGVGYAIVYDILAKIFDNINISLRYEDLFDAKTRIKELFDHYGKDNIGVLKYEETKNMETKLTTSILYQEHNGKRVKLAEGIASLKADAQQKSAQVGLTKMKMTGFVKPVDEIYNEFI